MSNPTTPHEFEAAQWETIESEQQKQLEQQHQQQHHQQHQHQHQQLHPPPISPLEYQPQDIQSRIILSQQHAGHDLSPIVLHPVQSLQQQQMLSHQQEVQRQMSSMSRRPSPAIPMHIQSGRTGQIREQRRNAAHPYKRKASVQPGLQIIQQSGIRGAPPPPPVASGSSMRPPAHNQLGLVPNVWATSTSAGSSTQSPVAPSPTSQMGHESATHSPAYHTATFSAHSPAERVPREQRQQQQPREHTYTMRCDADYDHETHRMKILMELPGVRKSDITIKLSTCLFNRVRQLTVQGRSYPTFPTPVSADGVHRLRERKHGYFSRTFAVQADIKSEDITATLEAGILTLDMYCGEPATADDAYEISIR